MSRQQRLAKKASKLLLELYKSGINELSITVDDQDVQLVVFIKPIRAVTATLRTEL